MFRVLVGPVRVLGGSCKSGGWVLLRVVVGPVSVLGGSCV